MTTMMIAQQEKQTIKKPRETTTKTKAAQLTKKNGKGKLETKRKKNQNTIQVGARRREKHTQPSRWRSRERLIASKARNCRRRTTTQHGCCPATHNESTTHLSKSEKRCLLFVGGGGARWITLSRSEWGRREKKSEWEIMRECGAHFYALVSDVSKEAHGGSSLGV